MRRAIGLVSDYAFRLTIIVYGIALARSGISRYPAWLIYALDAVVVVCVLMLLRLDLKEWREKRGSYRSEERYIVYMGDSRHPPRDW